MSQEIIKRNANLTETMYHEVLEVAQENSWSFSATLGKLTKIGLNHKEDLELKEIRNEKK